MKKVEISELRKNDMVLVVREILVTTEPAKRTVRDFTLARVSGEVIQGNAYFWLSWEVRYTDGKPHTEESRARLVLPLDKPESKGIYDKVEFYKFGTWDEKSKTVLPE